MSNKKKLRQDAILTKLQEYESISVEHLCQAFNVSEATIRRDLTDLDAGNRLHRVLGGAKVAENYKSELPVFDRIDEMKNEKMRIGRAAAQMVEDGDIIFISSGTTTMYLIPFLSNVNNLTVITNSLLAINKIVSLNNKINLISIGGTYRNSEQSFLGKMAVRELQALRANKLFIGVRSIHSNYGLTNDDLTETQVDREIISMAETVIIMADHTKFNKLAPAFLADLNDVNAIITDDGLDFESKTLFETITNKIKMV